MIQNSLETQSIIFLYRNEEDPELPEANGLKNQGQTCYMNALMQLLNTTHNVSTVPKNKNSVYPNLHKFVNKVFENPVDSSDHYNTFIKEVMMKDDKAQFKEGNGLLEISEKSDGKDIQRDPGEVLKKLMTYGDISEDFPIKGHKDNQTKNLFCHYPKVQCKHKYCKNGTESTRSDVLYDMFELEIGNGVNEIISESFTQLAAPPQIRKQDSQLSPSTIDVLTYNIAWEAMVPTSDEFGELGEACKTNVQDCRNNVSEVIKKKNNYDFIAIQEIPLKIDGKDRKDRKAMEKYWNQEFG